MRIEIAAVDPSSDVLAVRAILLNDSYEPVAVSRHAFVGPTLVATTASGMPMAESVEATAGGVEEPMTLQPFTFYGRERWFQDLSPDEYDFRAEYRPETGEPLHVVATIVHRPAGG